MTRLALLFIALPVLAAAQVPAAGGMASAAGMPLNDGGLPPGMLIVRVVRGGFSNNVAGEVVTLTANGALRRAQTGPDGRAQFMHLDPGTTVQVSARIDSRALESEAFTMPAESGVRVLLVGPGEGSIDDVAVAPVTLPPPRPAGPVDATVAPSVVAAAGVPAATPASGGEDDGVVMVKTVLACSSVFALGWMVLGRRAAGPPRASGATSSRPPSSAA